MARAAQLFAALPLEHKQLLNELSLRQKIKHWPPSDVERLFTAHYGFKERAPFVPFVTVNGGSPTWVVKWMTRQSGLLREKDSARDVADLLKKLFLGQYAQYSTVDLGSFTVTEAGWYNYSRRPCVVMARDRYVPSATLWEDTNGLVVYHKTKPIRYPDGPALLPEAKRVKGADNYSTDPEDWKAMKRPLYPTPPFKEIEKVESKSLYAYYNEAIAELEAYAQNLPGKWGNAWPYITEAELAQLDDQAQASV